MESGNIKTTIKNLYNTIFNSDSLKIVQNSSSLGKLKNTTENIKKQLTKNRTYTLILVIGFILLSLYLLFIFRRVPRYLNRLNSYKPILDLSPLDSYSFIHKKNYRLCDFYIASSYKSYLPCTNYYDYSSTCAIKQALIYGARYIDLDVYNKNFDQCTDPVVCNGKEIGNWHYTTPLSFDACCKVISEVAFSNSVRCPTDPLFININLYLNENIRTMNKVAESINHYFHHKLLPLKYAHQGINPNPKLGINITTLPIKDFIGKVIIICNDNFQHSNLDELVNISPKTVGNLRELHFSDIKNSHDSEELKEYNKKHMTRVIVDEVKRNKQNFNYTIPWYFGCQFICMDYFKPDDYIKSYLKRFSKCSFILKPYKLRYHPVYIKAPKKQIPQVSFAPEKVTTPFYSITY